MYGKIDIPYHYLSGVSFSVFTTEEILKLSVKELTNPQSFDQIGHPTIGGLYDPALGPTELFDQCKTCGLAQQTCPGHMGHIKLPFVVFNPVLFKILYQILRGTCFECHRLSAKLSILHLMKCQLKALDYGLFNLVDELRDSLNEMKANSGGEKSLDEDAAIENITALVDQALEGIDVEEARYRSQVKNVVELRQKLVKEFISGRCFQRTKCPHCVTHLRGLKQEQNNKMFFSSMAKKTITQLKERTPQNTVTLAKNMVKKKQLEDGDYEETGDLVEIEELEKKEKEEAVEKNKFQKIEHQILSPAEAKSHLAKVWEVDGELLSQIIGALQVKMGDDDCPTDVFFTDCIPVPPSKYRPLVVLRDVRMEGGQTKNFAKVLECSRELKDILRLIKESTENQGIPSETTLPLEDTLETFDKKAHMDKVHLAWTKLQTAVNTVFDSDLDKLSTDKQHGIKQLLEKKEGLFRKHMMGKRVNFAARSVISPDPYINTNEIGIPEVFAKKLYYPQPVTHWNFTQLKRAVINGPNVHPGASLVIKENGQKVILHGNNRTQREAIAKQLLTPSTSFDHTYGTKTVCRHLQNGDVLLLNRQPTLHKPSIQAHRARILKGEKTLRLHYANCKAYNADFDGDEMNAHFPQDEVSRAEAYNIASTDFQYLVPKDGTPLAGLIQDHMVAGVRLTIRGRFFNRQDYQQLVFAALTNKAGPVKLLPPSILKPRPMWSGKQVLSTVLLNVIPEGKVPLNLDGKSKISAKSFVNRKRSSNFVGWNETWPQEMDESRVIIRQGELLCGVLDKGHYGATAYGLVHCCYELYGGDVAGKLLTSFAKLFTGFLQLHGFTLGVQDILCTDFGNERRRKIMEEGAKCGNKTAAKALNLAPDVDPTTLCNKLQEAHFMADGSGLKDLDLSMKGSTDEIQNKISNVLMPNGLMKKFPDNNLQLMVQSGAKGSTVNCMQISCLLGQIELEGRRPPLMMSGQSLPSFPAYETSPRAGGFVDGRFLTGIRPQEYFFHCMAGREGLVDTAVKTSRSGYLQRCIIKHLEGLTVAYDQTVRDSDGSLVQFEYGEDGLEITKTQFLKAKQFPFLIKNQAAILSNPPDKVDTTKAEQLWEEYYKWHEERGKKNRSRKTSGFTRFCKKEWKKIVPNHNNNVIKKLHGRTEANMTMCTLWMNLSQRKKEKHKNAARAPPDPVVARISPAKHLGAVTENFQDLLNDFIDRNPDNLIREDIDVRQCSASGKHITEQRLKSLLYVNYMRSLVSPGEAVGLVAAQSVGEPSTQMTLNTFHFAGRGEMNVTLGIPRLREILMVASANISTPTMDIPLLPSEEAKQRGTKLKQKLNKVYLSQVLEDVEVVESLSVKNDWEKGRLYKIRFRFLPYEMYREEYCVTPSKILQYMETRFFKDRLMKGIEAKMRAMSKTTLLQSATLRKRDKEKDETEERDDSNIRADEDDDMSGDEQHDDDCVARKARARKDEENDYEGEEEEKQEVGEYESEEDEDSYMYGADDGMEPQNNETTDDSPPTSRPPTPVWSTTKKKRKETPEMSEKRITTVLANVSGSTAYKYDTLNELWCEITVTLSLTDKKLDMASCVESIARTSVVYQVPNINRCFLSESKKLGEEGIWRIKTEGVNIQEMYNYNNMLNLNELYSNDIHSMAHNYGIEAACSVLIQEIRDVFANYGIEVDRRHLSLIADYMTYEGEYKAFNRIGLESNASPLQKMTFETTMHFLRTATILGDRDDLKSPSSRLVTGQLVRGGTGAFQLMQKLKL